MNIETILRAIAIGAGATLTIDLWAMLLRRAFEIRSLDYCLLGRWVLHMPQGTFAHASIVAAAPKTLECPVGWTAHYSIGATFGVMFVLLVGEAWLARPTVLPALAFGITTVLVPYFVMQPALGLGVASSRTPRPAQARLKSLATHAVFGLGLWLWATLSFPALR